MTLLGGNVGAGTLNRRSPKLLSGGFTDRVGIPDDIAETFDWAAFEVPLAPIRR